MKSDVITLKPGESFECACCDDEAVFRYRDNRHYCRTHLPQPDISGAKGHSESRSGKMLDYKRASRGW